MPGIIAHANRSCTVRVERDYTRDKGKHYFATVAMGGKLYVDGISEREPWDAKRLVYWDEPVVDMLVSKVVHRKAVTIDEVKTILHELEKGLPAIRVWVREGLEDAVRYPPSGSLPDPDDTKRS